MELNPTELQRIDWGTAGGMMPVILIRVQWAILQRKWRRVMKSGSREVGRLTDRVAPDFHASDSRQQVGYGGGEEGRRTKRMQRDATAVSIVRGGRRVSSFGEC